MGVVVTLAVVAALCLALGLLLKLLVQLMSSVAWGSILLTGFWVVANILLILKLEALGEQSVLLRWAHRAWSGFFFYTSLLQAVVFITLTFWALSLIFRPEVSPPESMAEFVLDFVKGSSALAAFVFLGTGGFALTGEPSAGLKVMAVAYLIVVAAGAVLPWLPAVPLAAWVGASPAFVLWSTLGVYGLLSTAGMALYAASMGLSPSAS